MTVQTGMLSQEEFIKANSEALKLGELSPADIKA